MFHFFLFFCGLMSRNLKEAELPQSVKGVLENANVSKDLYSRESRNRIWGIKPLPVRLKTRGSKTDSKCPSVLILFGLEC